MWVGGGVKFSVFKIRLPEIVLIRHAGGNLHASACMWPNTEGMSHFYHMVEHEISRRGMKQALQQQEQGMFSRELQQKRPNVSWGGGGLIYVQSKQTVSGDCSRAKPCDA